MIYVHFYSAKSLQNVFQSTLIRKRTNWSPQSKGVTIREEYKENDGPDT